MSKNDKFKILLNGKSSYAIIKYEGKIEYVYIHCFKDFNDDGDWYLEYPCQLYNYGAYNELEDKSFVEENQLIIDDYIYEIINWQCSPWIPNFFEAELISEIEMAKILISIL